MAEFLEVDPHKLTPLHQIRPPSQKRAQALVPSLIELGVLQPGLGCHLDKGIGIFAGFTRWEAAKIAKLPKFPMHVFPAGLDIDQMVIMAMAENNARSSMNFAERADAVLLVAKETGLSISGAAKLCGISASEASQVISCQENLEDSVRLKLANANIGHGTAYILALQPHDVQLAYVDRVLEGMPRAELKRELSQPTTKTLSIKVQATSYETILQSLKDRMASIKSLQSQGIPFDKVKGLI